MQFRVGQQVKFKTDSPPFNLPQDADMTVTMVAEDRGLVCVTIKAGGAHWLKGEDLESAEGGPEEGERARPVG